MANKAEENTKGIIIEKPIEQPVLSSLVDEKEYLYLKTTIIKDGTVEKFDPYKLEFMVENKCYIAFPNQPIKSRRLVEAILADKNLKDKFITKK